MISYELLIIKAIIYNVRFVDIHKSCGYHCAYTLVCYLLYCFI